MQTKKNFAIKFVSTEVYVSLKTMATLEYVMYASSSKYRANHMVKTSMLEITWKVFTQGKSYKNYKD